MARKMEPPLLNFMLLRNVKSVIRISLLVLVVASANSCGDKSGRAIELERSLAADLPLGTSRVEVEKYLDKRGIDHGFGGVHPIINDGQVYDVVVGSIDVNSWIYANAKIRIEFYFDREGRLVLQRVRDTFAAP